jgi:transcriptional regulator GlxA family with amidase domain
LNAYGKGSLAVDSKPHEEIDMAESFVQRAGTLLRAEAPSIDLPLIQEQTDQETAAPTRTRLAPWQIRKVRTYIAERVNTTTTNKDLALLVRLSPFHFSRAFKNTFGDSPHRYLLRRRMEHAQDLMLATSVSLAEIALECGFVDQAHFGRTFRRIVGETPTAWRRARIATR